MRSLLPLCLRGSVLVLTCLAGSTAPLLAQVAVVDRNVNLRVDPSTDEEPVRLLLPGEEVQVLDELRKVNRYFHVITAQNEEGWVWSPNVTVDLDRDLEMVTAPSEIFHGCPIEGSATTASARALNVQKNRFTDPVASDMNSAATLTAILQPGDDSTRWTTTTAAEVVGRVHDIKLGSVETVNCRASEHELRDTHIELVLAATDSAPARRAAAAFTTYMNSAATVRWILLAQDEKQGLVPRYLLPATLSGLEDPDVQRDPYYREFRTLIRDAAFPNSGLLLTRRRMNTALSDALK